LPAWLIAFIIPYYIGDAPQTSTDGKRAATHVEFFIPVVYNLVLINDYLLKIVFLVDKYSLLQTEHRNAFWLISRQIPAEG
jgi:hypothetical protein